MISLRKQIEAAKIRQGGLKVWSTRLQCVMELGVMGAMHALQQLETFRKTQEQAGVDTDATPSQIKQISNSMAYVVLKGLGGLEGSVSIECSDGKEYNLEIGQDIPRRVRDDLYSLLIEDPAFRAEMSEMASKVSKTSAEEVDFFAEGHVIGRDTVPETTSSESPTQAATSSS